MIFPLNICLILLIFLLITFDLMWTQTMMQVAYTTAFDELSSMPSLLLDLALERYDQQQEASKHLQASPCVRESVSISSSHVFNPFLF